MLTTLTTAGAADIHLDLGHVAVFRELAKAAALSAEVEAQLFDIYQRKSIPELNAIADTLACKEWFVALGQLSGNVEVLAQARLVFSEAPASVKAALADLQQIAEALSVSHPQVEISFDLSELRGYHYHTGLVFATYTPKSAAEIAKGGRYDHIGEAFGRARPATGFSADLKSLVNFVVEAPDQARIYAPASTDAALCQAIARLRQEGRIVIQALAGDSCSASQLGCRQQLVDTTQGWQLQPV
jgi:ATP phosphoribosyltransferase regulatory subunit